MKVPQIYANDKSKISPNSDQRNTSHDKNEGKSSKKPKNPNAFTYEMTSSPSKNNKSKIVLKSKELIISYALSKYPNCEDLWSKYKENLEEIKKKKEAFFSVHLKNQTLYQGVFDKLKGVHFATHEKKADNLIFLNEAKKVITWNISYNPYLFLGFIFEDIIYENLQVNF